MIEYPMHNFDVAPTSKTRNSPQGGSRRVVPSLRDGGRDSCVRTRSNFGLESHHDLHCNTCQDESTLVKHLSLLVKVIACVGQRMGASLITARGSVLGPPLHACGPNICMKWLCNVLNTQLTTLMW